MDAYREVLGGRRDVRDRIARPWRGAALRALHYTSVVVVVVVVVGHARKDKATAANQQ
jgi:hypothetical protein